MSSSSIGSSRYKPSRTTTAYWRTHPTEVTQADIDRTNAELASYKAQIIRPFMFGPVENESSSSPMYNSNTGASLPSSGTNTAAEPVADHPGRSPYLHPLPRASGEPSCPPVEPTKGTWTRTLHTKTTDYAGSPTTNSTQHGTSGLPQGYVALTNPFVGPFQPTYNPAPTVQPIYYAQGYGTAVPANTIPPNYWLPVDSKLPELVNKLRDTVEQQALEISCLQIKTNLQSERVELLFSKLTDMDNYLAERHGNDEETDTSENKNSDNDGAELSQSMTKLEVTE